MDPLDLNRKNKFLRYLQRRRMTQYLKKMVIGAHCRNKIFFQKLKKDSIATFRVLLAFS